VEVVMICKKRNELNQAGEKIAERIWIFCPGCEEAHALRVNSELQPGWIWNGDLEKPTFNPSLLATGAKRCHSFIKDGKIQFLADSQHKLAGQTVDLPELPDWLAD
jgi:hypothetical protein